ncbi:Josephin-domain-containing protein [Lentinus brumalis]|uniref:ubiquitinyl hydrolase 1 n=1 Tax=Lentinus brumalis TaxID=2498619 RepID=A0A371CP89_9APHY|nr:Josephin-domain-containing protein [Polyporus brumalis]
MATVQNIIPLIYHEKQEPGEMLCAQHALNSLLQGQYFSAPDLSEIAHELDEDESRELDEEERAQTSNNMDDTAHRPDAFRLPVDRQYCLLRGDQTESYRWPLSSRAISFDNDRRRGGGSIGGLAIPHPDGLQPCSHALCRSDARPRPTWTYRYISPMPHAFQNHIMVVR